jgi:membrane-associated phospholipid phosphatase
MRLRYIAAIAAMSTLTRVAAGQSVGKMLEDDFKNSAKDWGAVWSAPFDASGRDWMIAAATLGVFGISMFADQSVSDWAIKNDSSAFFRAIKPVRRGGKLYSGKYVVPPVAAVYVVGLAVKNQDMRDFVTGCMTSWGAQSYARKAAAAVFGRARPDTMPNDPQHWKMFGGGFGDKTWMMRSFPAGHFANAVACATYWNHRFRLGAAEPALYALAAAVGIGRFADKAHWLSDTVVGGVLGYAVGKEVARRSLQRNTQRITGSGGSGASVNILPEAGGVQMSVRWTF